MGSNLTTFKGCTNPHIGCFTLIYYVAHVVGQKNWLQGEHGSLWLWPVMTLWPKFGCNMDLGCFGCATKMRSLTRLGFILLLHLSRLWSKSDHMLDLVHSSCNLYPNCNKNLIISWPCLFWLQPFFSLQPKFNHKMDIGNYLFWLQPLSILWQKFGHRLDLACFGCDLYPPCS